jgi:hypothetical protein
VPIYHPAFFEHIEQLYGLTGTINEDDESNEVKLVYNVVHLIYPLIRPVSSIYNLQYSFQVKIS